MATTIAETPPAAKQPKSGYGINPSFQNEWDQVAHIQPLQQKTPHRYMQSPVFSRKATTSCPAESFEHHSHHHHHHNHHKQRRHHSAHRRRRGNSEGDKLNLAPEERVHLLSELPWRKSGDFSSSSGSDDSLEGQVSTPSIPRLNIPAMSPTLPRRYDRAPNFERERTWSMPTRQRPHFSRKGKQRARSQDSSPSSRKSQLELPIEGFQYSGSLVLGVKNVASEFHSHDPDEPETPLADSNGFLKVPDLNLGQSPESLRRFLGLEMDVNHNYKGLSEDDIRQSRLMSRRGSSSSDSSTSTLT